MPSRKPAKPNPSKSKATRADRSKQSPGVPLAMRPVNWVRDLLKRPLHVERRGLQVHVLLGPPPAAPEEPPEPPEPLAAGEALRRGHAELRALLRRHPETRHLMRHLGFLEQTLGRSGSRALKRGVPVPVLRKALSQLDLLARDEPSEALTDLRSRIEAAIRARAAEETVPQVREAALQVSEASHSLFDEMERSWTGRMPLSPDKPDERGE